MPNTNNIIADHIVIGSGYVPIIDISGARSGDLEKRKITAEFIDKTCRESGFLILTGHGIPQDAIDDIHRVSQLFFQQSQHEKERLKHNAGDIFARGYHYGGSLDASNKDVDVKNAWQTPDMVEKFVFNPLGESGAREKYTWPHGDPHGDISDEILWLPNKWPAIPHFKEITLRYVDLLQDLADDIMRLFALALDLPENWFDDKIDQKVAQMLINYYPAHTVSPKSGQIRLGKHSDWGSLTILFQDDQAEGLQVLDKHGNWVNVPCVPGSYVVNIGDLMAIWTNDTWVSTVHRVCNPPEHLTHKERFSIPFFHQPNHDALIECLPSCQNKNNPPKHKPVLSGHYLAEKYSRSY